MGVSLMGFDTPFFLYNLHNILEAANDNNNKSSNTNNNAGPTRAYVPDARTTAATPADVKEYPNSYVFIIDMPGLKSGDVKVQVEDDNVLVISGERKREHEENNKGVKYVRMERRIGKFMRKFSLPKNSNTDKISAICQDEVLTVIVEKLPPSEPKKPKMIQVQVK
ncbi:17.9 kDa class II heat shock protein-like [Rutidosis leptorrhynchoides]|uniref:17.9 kDa class II heat shock protein-like n=1 Tax=Rutidosis leptorrhynchoides TaxID=125765 RepID=UPI003A9A301C